MVEALKHSTLKRFKTYLIPLGVRSIVYKKMFAVGDTGGIVDPISGKGIPYSMISGQSFLGTLKAKRIACDRIIQNDTTLKQFLSL